MVLQHEGRAISRQGRKKDKTKTHLSAFSVLGIRQLMRRWMDRRTDGGESEHTAVLRRYQRRVKHRREPFFGDDFIDLRERLTEMENAKACLEYPRRRTLITPRAWNNSARGTKGPPIRLSLANLSVVRLCWEWPKSYLCSCSNGQDRLGFR